jgi:hypothetical protein
MRARFGLESLKGRLKRTWEYSIELDFKEVRWKGVDWIHLAEDRDQ